MAKLEIIGVFLSCMLIGSAASAKDAVPKQPHHEAAPASDVPCQASPGEGFNNIQIETTDIRLHEQFFEAVLHASLVQRLDHPLTDYIRVYCYREVLVVIRQDLRTPRPTGWVQVNFLVPDAVALQEELESAASTAFAALGTEARERIVRFRLKQGVMRGSRRVSRLEVYGPEGFLVGFDQPQQ